MAINNVSSMFPAYWTPSELNKLFPVYPDFPIAGVLFRDITPFLCSTERAAAYDEWHRRIMASPIGTNNNSTAAAGIDGILYCEARGWILSPIETRFATLPAAIIARKSGKLPAAVVSQSYGLEYNSNSELQVTAGSIIAGKRYLVLDDVAVTMGTLGAAVKLIERCGGVVAGVTCLLLIPGLAAPNALPADCPFLALCTL